MNRLPQPTAVPVALASKAKLDHALELAASGFNVFPITPNRKKKPLVTFTADATKDEKQIRAWWDVWPDANIGICTTGLLVIDVDVKGKHNGDTSLDLLEDRKSVV